MSAPGREARRSRPAWPRPSQSGLLWAVPVLLGWYGSVFAQVEPAGPFRDSPESIVEVPPQSVANRGYGLIPRQLTPGEQAKSLDVEIALKMRNAGELSDRIGRGELIDRGAMDDRYYPLQADYDRVVDWVRGMGLEVTQLDPSRLAVFARGSVDQLSRGFHAAFGRVLADDGEYTSAISTPQLPVALAPVLLGVNGLQPHLHPRRHLSLRPSAFGSYAPPYLPAQIAHAYAADKLAATGANQEIAIVIDTFPSTSDLATFWSQCGIGQSLGNVSFVQVVTGTLPSPSGEETLDVEWSSSMAPGAKVRVYATTDLSFVHIDSAYSAIGSDLASRTSLHQLSLSFGLGEKYASLSQVQTDDQYFANLASAGMTILVSSGDGGSSPGPTGQDHSGPVQAETPASDPNVIAVGGTTLNLNAATGNVTSETAWYGSGGGASIYFERPPWQTGTGVPAGSTRLVPDVAAAADPNTGGYLVLNGGAYIVGGTSWSAPVWAGFCALVNESLANNGSADLNHLGPRIYPLAGGGRFTDIVSGSNGASGIYNAGVGYDLCTGLGSPNVRLLSDAFTPASSDIPAMPGWALAVLALLLAAIAVTRKRRRAPRGVPR